MDIQATYDLNRVQRTPSARSRASSVFSTGTKLSITTMQREDFQSFEPGFAGPSSDIRPRRRSLLSVTLDEQPAPPYNDQQALNVPQGFSSQNSTATSEQPPSLSTDDFNMRPISTEYENELSAHYGRIVRTIDQKYRADLLQLTQSHERELAATRHEIDQAYRKEWKAKNREVEQFREEANTRIATVEAEMKNMILAHKKTVDRLQGETDEKIIKLTEAHGIAIDKARNAIEDLWEERWSGRKVIAKVEARIAKLENERKLEKAVADRDKEWVRELGNRHPELLDELKVTITKLRAGT